MIFLLNIKYKSFYTISIILLLLLIFNSCSNVINDEHAYFKYLSNPKHNLLKTKYINGFKLTVKYMAPEMLAYNELEGKNYTQNSVDSLIQIYKNSRTFVLTIAPDDRKEETNDVMYYNVMNTLDFKERVQTMNFNINEYITLNTERHTFYPALHLFENTYGLSKQRNINVVFSAEEANNDLLTSEDLDFIYNDYIFQTGISHFQFKKKDLDKIPKINFWNVKNK